ncbi:MAG TPA: CPBP family intramembrane glutamic endopeptidase [Pseudonocardiaceae bacterium]|nr:CPBP family intramembrane glutamic endopeptidase [Pseudonocardiaceae bacterium]
MRDRVRAWLVPEPPAGVRHIETPDDRRAARIELLIVFTVTLGLSGVRSLISLLDSLLQPVPLSQQRVAINVPQARTGFLDLIGQLANAAQLVAWGSLGVYLLWRAGYRLADIGIDRQRPGRDAAGGVGLAALIGIPGLGLYLVARALNLNLTVLPTTLGDTWWRIPVLVVAAAANAWAEEALVVGYFISRLRQLGLHENASVSAAAVLRGSYHLYQGFGGFVGNLVMGLVFGRVWQRTNRLWPLVVAHTLLDVASFVGYAVLASHVSWLR